MEKTLKKLPENLHIQLITIIFTSEIKNKNGWNLKQIKIKN